MLFDRENFDHHENLPTNRFRVEFGVRFAGVTNEDWVDDSIGNSSHEAKDYKTKRGAVAFAEKTANRLDVSWCSVIEIQPVITCYCDTTFGWEDIDEFVWD